MSDGPTPERPPGWSAEQPPPYGAPPASPWTAPGSGPEQVSYGQPYGDQPPPPPYGAQQQPPPPYHAQQPPPPPPPGYGYMPPPQALRPGIIPLRPLGLGDILDGAIKFIRSNPKAVLGLSGVAAAIASVPLAIALAVLNGQMLSLSNDPESIRSGDYLSSLLAGYSGVIVSTLVGFVVTTVLTGMLTRILGRSVFGGKVTPGEAWNLVKGRMPALFGVVILVGLVMLAPLLVLVPLLVVLVANTGSAEGVAGLLGLTLLLILAYVVYTLFFYTKFAFAAPIVVLEGRGPVDAMRRSWRLVKGDFWRVLGILLLTGLLAYLASSLLSMPFSVAAQLLTMAGAGGGGAGVIAISAVLIAIGSTLASMIVYPLQAAIAGLLYADRRMRSEAFDLVLQTAALEQQRQGWVHSSADELWHPSNAAGS
ncbi:glycerophosphoryl diester phosphodiesterase membrane domain-containing protein [Nonomuraea typhae]|uniref:glycerophosphoryl diester phosphodiesterase membrane domain-containing protein n=1 Tax=Nonomuraea typhae TaxID=2603600 RepID=UPI001FE39E60|nr:glycerophosphoryl diester phosphodiesterase membrane domain-containing protein [Nonomuraea typhae]